MTTLNVKQRLSQHISSINTKKDTSISNHFNLPGHNIHHLKIALLDTNISNRLDLRMREGYWIHLLQTTSNGLNKKEEISMLNYQILSLIPHFRHSKTCFPYCLFNTENIETLNLQAFRRILLPKKKRHSALRSWAASPNKQHVHRATPNKTLRITICYDITPRE